MRRLPILAVLLSLVVASGCARQASTRGEQRLATPSMADQLGPPGLSRDNKSYLAADPP
jgi:hypothetical protein